MTSYDVIAEYYDFDMGRNNPGKDICFYAGHAVRAGGLVLELGCGTGRITLSLVKAGCHAVGIDISRAMLDQLERKRESALSVRENARLAAYRLDMRAFDLGMRFPLIICPFAAFTYLAEEEDRWRCFEAVKKHLTAGGVFIVDSFVPRPEVESLPDDHLFCDYRREIGNGLSLERHKTIQKDPGHRMNTITRRYRVLDGAGRVVRAFSTRERIRYFFQREMELLLRRNGFEILHAYGDYENRPYDDGASMMVFVTRVAAGCSA